MKFISNSSYGKPVETGTIFYTTVNGITVTIHRIIHLDGWFLSCAQFQIDDQKLKAESLPGAIEESKEILKGYVKNVNDFINRYASESWEISRY